MAELSLAEHPRRDALAESAAALGSSDDELDGPDEQAPYSVLILEDCADHFELLVTQLESAGVRVRPTLVDNEADYRQGLRGRPDAILADYRLDAFDGRRALQIREECAHHTPFILVSGYLSDADAMNLMRGGATDFLLKDRLGRLAPALVSAILASRREVRRIRDLKAVLDGAVAALSEALALANPPAFARALRIRDIARAIAGGIDGVDPVDVGTIALLSQLGSLTLPHELATKLHEGRAVSDTERWTVRRLPSATEGLLASIPGLDHARRVIRCQDVDFDADGPVPVEAMILRVAIAYDRMETRGTPFGEALRRLRARAHLYGDAVIDALAATRAHDQDTYPAEEIDLGAARTGWILASDVVSRSGVLLIGRGHPISAALRDRLRAFHEAGMIDPTVWVRRSN